MTSERTRLTRIYRQFSGAKLKAAREAIGVSRNRLAPWVGCTVMSIYNWETGRKVPSAQYLDALAANLRVKVDELYDVQEGMVRTEDAKSPKRR
jgi:DNA-binding transcriptional regulator YiaG